LIQLTLTNEYQQSPLLNPVVGGNNEIIAQTTPGGAITLPGQGTLTRAGHTFAGWSLVTTNGSGTVVGATYTPTVPVKLYSSWTPNVYVVTYNANGGNGAPTATTQNYTYGSTALAITSVGTLSRTGYTFGGWNTLATGAGTNYSAGASYTPTASIILYAKWTAGTFTLTYNANGGTTNSSTSITAGTAVTLSTTAGTRAGYTLAGWNTAADGSGTSYAGATSQTFFANTTLYGLWTPAIPGAPSVTATSAGNTTATVTVTGAAVSGTTAGPATSYSIQTFASDGTTSIAGKTCTVLASASPLSCQITGLTNGTTYKFKATAINTTGSSTSVISTVTAIPAPFVVTYSLNSGTLATTTANFNLGTPLTLPLPTRSGYTFGGWSESQTGTAVVSPYSPTQTRTLYAIWSGISYSVSFNVNGGTGSVADAVYVTGATGLTLSDGTGLSRTGYTFGGWRNLAGTTVSGSPYVATENVTLYAIWTPKTIVVTYDKGIATTIPTIFPASPVNSTFGANFTLGTSDTSTVISSGNYAFAGWKIGTETYKPGDSYRIIGEAPITVTAQWIQLFEVTYNTNGGTFAGGDGVNDSQCVSRLCTDGQAIQLNLAPTRTGFTFVEWVSQTGANFAPAATTNVSSTNYIFYATWTPNSYTINFAAGTGSNGAASAITDSHGSTVQLAASTGYSLSGSIFTGWLIGATTYPAGAFYTMGTDASPITATAQYTNNTFKIFYNTNGSTAGSTPAATTAASGAAINLDNATGFSRIGFTFNGWSNGTNILVAGFGTTMGSANSTLIDPMAGCYTYNTNNLNSYRI